MRGSVVLERIQRFVVLPRGSRSQKSVASELLLCLFCIAIGGAWMAKRTCGR